MNKDNKDQQVELKEAQYIKSSEVNQFIDSLKNEDPIYTQVLIGKLVSGQFLVIPDNLDEPDYAGYEEWADNLENDYDYPTPEDLN